MLTIPRRRCRWPAAVALALTLGVPALAEAQLFPNLPLHKRPKNSCAHEAPVFSLYRHQYYGYHPTCWRQFPPGWGCPSPEAPNTAAAMEEIRRELQQQPAPGTEPEEGAPTEGPETAPGMPGQPETELPPLPRQDRSPFDLDPGGSPSDRLRGRPGGAASPEGPSPFTPPVNRSTPPFESALPSLSPAGEAGGPPIDQPLGPAASAGAEAAPPVALLDLGVATPPPSPDPAREALPLPASPPPSPPGPAIEALPGPLPPAPPVVQAPQRRGGLSGLFQNWNRRRR